MWNCSSTTTPSAITIASNGNITLSGDLTISGDDLVIEQMLWSSFDCRRNKLQPNSVTDLTAISSGDITSGADVLMIQDVDLGVLKRLQSIMSLVLLVVLHLGGDQPHNLVAT